MHVTHIVAHPPYREGTGTACFYNAQALRALGCETTVYAPAWHLTDGDRQLNYYRFAPCWLKVEKAVLTPGLLTAGKTDIFHLHYPFIFGAELVLARAAATRTPLVVTYHNDLIGSGIRRPAFFGYNRLNAPLILRSAAKIAVVSHDHAASTHFGSTIFRERDGDVVEIGNGVDTARFHPEVDGMAVREQYQIPRDATVLLFVSNLDRAHVRKGLLLVLEALATLSDNSLRLLVAGDGELRETYADCARSLGIGGQVIFAGRIPHDRLPAYYAACDIVVMPSRPPESFGLAIAEGMATGKPVLAGNIPGVRTLVKDGETGFLVDPSDCADLVGRLALLVRDEALRLAMGRRSWQRIVEHYTWRKVGERLLALYDSLLQKQAALVA
ncbi:glycosyltransferase family 4 protein [Candidatus Chloroploca sp. Khr17]|uniref:glycosyltransferase family 4 protein n=1 Tax=Candidatus Chloroploca sp. Khr17 TaxID=2496869 RepID=UPI0013EDEAFF|nr:glycosyltransferase family 4 protein [Candidatus Chloroploca sp. Khr17]